MQVAVVTPCYKPRVEWLTRCVQSVARQTVPCTHIVVSDGDSTAYDLGGICIQHIRLPRSHRDYGDTPRAIGSVSAVSQGFDAIAWLDADNWYATDHVETLVELHHQTKACVCTSGRMLCQGNGQPLGACYEVNGVDFVDTNCFLITREAFQLIPVWFLMDSNLHVGGDRVVWHYVRDWKLAHAHTGRPTIYYRTQLRAHYQYFGVPAPKDARDLRVPVRT